MKVKYRRKFLKELAGVPIKIRMRIEKFVFEYLPNLDSIYQSSKIERMKGYPDYYKARFGLYRVGLKRDEDIVILERVLHRKDIYRFFP